MSCNHYSKSHINQVAKMIFPILVVLAIGLVIADVFGANSFITTIFFKKVVFTPYNIVGMILFVLFLGGVWVGRGKAKVMFGVVSILTIMPTLIKINNFLKSDLAAKIFDFVAIALIVVVGLLIIIPIIVVIVKSIYERKEEKKQKDKFISKQQNSLSDGDIMKYIVSNVENKKQQTNKNVVEKNNFFRNTQSSQNTNYRTFCIKDTDDWKIANRICPQCGAKLCARTNGYDGTYFLGCTKYGKTGCDFTINYVDYYAMRERLEIK